MKGRSWAVFFFFFFNDITRWIVGTSRTAIYWHPGILLRFPWHVKQCPHHRTTSCQNFVLQPLSLFSAARSEPKSLEARLPIPRSCAKPCSSALSSFLLQGPLLFQQKWAVQSDKAFPTPSAAFLVWRISTENNSPVHYIYIWKGPEDCCFFLQRNYFPKSPFWQRLLYVGVFTFRCLSLLPAEMQEV